jgi:hypothetical protein
MVVGAKRKLSYGTTPLKKAKVMGGAKKAQTFAAKVKKVVLRAMETKRTNGYTKWNDYSHNSIISYSGVAGTVAPTRNGPSNSLYCTSGSLPHERDGKKIYVNHIDIQVHLQQLRQVANTVAYSYNACTMFRTKLNHTHIHTHAGL